MRVNYCRNLKKKREMNRQGMEYWEVIWKTIQRQCRELYLNLDRIKRTKQRK